MSPHDLQAVTARGIVGGNMVDYILDKRGSHIFNFRFAICLWLIQLAGQISMTRRIIRTASPESEQPVEVRCQVVDRGIVQIVYMIFFIRKKPSINVCRAGIACHLDADTAPACARWHRRSRDSSGRQG